MGQRYDPKSDYRYDFFKPIYSGKQHYTVDYYCKEQEDGKLHYLAELQLFRDSAKEPLMIEEKAKGKLEIVSETNISADLRRQIIDLIKEHSKYYGNGNK